MAYFKIGTIDFSDIVSELSVKYSPVYNKQTNAAGNTVVDLLGSKRSIEVKIIPIDKDKMAALLAAIKNNSGVDAKNLHATTYLIIGNNSRFEDYNSTRTGCFWIGS